MARYAPLVCLGLEALVLAGLGWHAHHREAQRAGDERTIATIARLLPATDLSLAGPAQHLKAPSLEEPGAAFADQPASPDIDPAGGAIAPPIDVYSDIAAAARPKRRAEPLGQGPLEPPQK